MKNREQNMGFIAPSTKAMQGQVGPKILIVLHWNEGH